MKKFTDWRQEQTNEDLKTALLGTAATAALAGSAQGAKYGVNVQSYGEKPATTQIADDSIEIRALDKHLEQSIKGYAAKKPYYQEFNINIIQAKSAGKAELIVEVNAVVNANSEEEAKKMVTRDIMMGTGMFTAQNGNNLQKLLNLKDLRDMQIIPYQENTGAFQIHMKFRIGSSSGS